jgi:hypothetical protein
MENNQEKGKEKHNKNLAALDLCFILMIGALMSGAFISALTYDFVSARTPIVIMIPMLIMIAIQIKKSFKAAGFADIAHSFNELIRGKYSEFNGVAGFFGWMLLLLLWIFLAGHYAGMMLFMFMLLYLLAEEKLILSLSISVIVTLVIYLLFEQIFNIALNRGLVYQVWNGYSLF